MFVSAFFAAGFLGPLPASAQDIPEDMLLVDYANCMKNCLESEGQMTCEVLCGCTMSRFRSELDMDSYSALLEEMNRDEISPDNRAFLDETAQMCVAELDRLMGEMGLEEPEKGTALPPPELEDEDGEGN